MHNTWQHSTAQHIASQHISSHRILAHLITSHQPTPKVPLDSSITTACEDGASYTAKSRLAGKRSALQPIVQRLIAVASADAVPMLD